MMLEDARVGMSHRIMVSGIEYPATGLVEYVVPLRRHLDVRLVLPRDLTRAEVRRLEAYLHALAEEEREEVASDGA